MQTILGSGGAIGTELAKALIQHTDKIRLVSRNPRAVNSEDELFPADLTKPEELRQAIKGSSIAYLTVGFAYHAKVWEEHWPKLVQETVAACKENGTKLVFFDNIYMYDPDFLEGMTEETPINPPSQKGKIRADIAKIILDEVKAGALTALIARSADFYGPGIKDVSILTETVFKNLAAGKRAFWLGKSDRKHSFTYTPDAGRATALLGNTPDAYQQVWHLPTAADPHTGKAWISAIAQEMGVKPKSLTVPNFMVQMMGLFDPFMKEVAEMMYQYNRHYVFDSSKFERRFHVTPTPYAKGVKEIVAKDYPKLQASKISS